MKRWPPAVLSPAWLEVLLRRAFEHDNDTVRSPLSLSLSLYIYIYTYICIMVISLYSTSLPIYT